jgi:hypothetical protein
MKPGAAPAGHLTISKRDLADRINRLPDWARKYIHDLETRADPSGDIQELADLRDQRDSLVKMVEQLKRENARLRRSLATLRKIR